MPGVITISCLGSKGRAGNSFFQWAFARGYSMAVDAVLQTPDWFGRRIFSEAAEEPLIDRSLPKTHCDSVCLQMGLPLGYFIGKTNIDLDLYAQHQTFVDFYSRRQVREWFRLKPEFESYAPNKEITGQYSAMHLRRGDYTTDPTFQRLYCTVSDESYAQAIKQFNIPSPVLRVFDGCRPAIPDLEAIGLDWLVDFLMLRGADHLLRSNSTFAWWASALGNGKTYSPVVENKVGLQHVGFVHGNHPNTAGIFPNQSNLILKE